MLGCIYFDGCSSQWNGFICTCATCYDLQGDALISMYRCRGSVRVERAPGTVLVLRGDDVDEWYLVDQSGMVISW